MSSKAFSLGKVFITSKLLLFSAEQRVNEMLFIDEYLQQISDDTLAWP